jgi:hypothetical protein
MPLAIRVFPILLLLGTFSLAQAQNPGIQVGYAIVTVLSGSSAGISPVETLTYNAFGVTTQTAASPAPLLTNSALVVDLGDPEVGTTGIAITNPATTTAHVQLSVTDKLGIPILNQTISILPRGQFSQFVNELFAGQITSSTPATALLTVTADTPIGLVALNFLQAGIATSPLTSLANPFPMPVISPVQNTVIATVNGGVNQFTTIGTAIMPTSPVMPPVTTTTLAVNQAAQAASTIGGSASFLFPQVATGDGWSTDITVANNSATQQTIRIDFFDQNGALVQSVVGATVPSRGLFSLAR